MLNVIMLNVMSNKLHYESLYDTLGNYSYLKTKETGLLLDIAA